MARTVARSRPEPRRRLTWPPGAPPVGTHAGTGRGLLRAARRTRQIGATAIQIFSDNPTAWRRRPEPPPDAEAFVAYCAREGIAPIAIHASYLVNLAGPAEPFASRSRELLAAELARAPGYGASLVNTHIGSHRGSGVAAGVRQVAEGVLEVLDGAPRGVRLVLENSAGGGDTIGSSIEQLAAILDRIGGRVPVERLGFCLDAAHLWGAGYDLRSDDGALGVVDRVAELIGLEWLALVHLNDSRSPLGSRTDRHEHLAAGQMGAEGFRALLRDPRLASTPFIMETPGEDEGWDAVNLRRAWQLWNGATELPELPPKAFLASRRSTRVVG
jgi:deoxyribonuclease-4